jgi:hypothetical protein
MSADFRSPWFKRPEGRAAREWLITWAEVVRGEHGPIEAEPKPPGPRGLSAARCRHLDVEITIGRARVLRQVLRWRYVYDQPLSQLLATGEVRRLIDESGVSRLDYWRFIHESFCRRLVRTRSLTNTHTSLTNASAAVPPC